MPQFHSKPAGRSLRVRTSSLALIAILAALSNLVSSHAQSDAPQPDSKHSDQDLREQVKELREMVQSLQAQVNVLKTRLPAIAETAPAATQSTRPSTELAITQPPSLAPPATAVQPAPIAQPPVEKSVDFLHGTTLNFLLDGYYEYNFNSPIGRDNLLRAYDVSSNAFSLNQAAIVLENAPDPSKGKRYGARLDLQFGQATETLQGNSSNEPRPDIYRNIFQAYGTYIFPLNQGLTLNFGKWASSLGIEGNYTKDQVNYSRSYWFNFLPFYHMGISANYKINEKVAFNYWIVNGTNQTEPTNGFKDELFGLALQPAKKLSWTVNYYLGQEHPDFQYVTNGAPNLPTIQGAPFEPIANAANGKLHIFDSYATWTASPKLTLSLESDYVIERLQSYSSPSHTDGGAAYARYQLSPRWGVGGRAEYLSDRGGLFSGTTQALKEVTETVEFNLANGLQIKEEWRHDFTNQPYFLTDTLGPLSHSQTTAGLGLVYWFGGKDGSW